MVAALLCIGYDGSRPLPTTPAEKTRLVNSVCEYIYRMRPLAEWSRFSAQHLEPRTFLFQALSTIAFFRSSRAALLARCKPLKRQIATRIGLQQWFTSGVPEMALHRAQLLTLGVSAIMHRTKSPSPGRDFLLFVRVRGCFYRALLYRESRGPVSHTAAASALRT